MKTLQRCTTQGKQRNLFCHVSLLYIYKAIFRDVACLHGNVVLFSFVNRQYFLRNLPILKPVFFRTSECCDTRRWKLSANYVHVVLNKQIIFHQLHFYSSQCRTVYFIVIRTFASCFVRKSMNPKPLWVPVPLNFFGSLAVLSSPKTLEKDWEIFSKLHISIDTCNFISIVALRSIEALSQ